MTYSLDFQANLTETIVFPASCTTTSCDQIEQMFQASPPDGATSVHCAAALGGACNCNATLPPQTSTQTGMYSLSGTNITTGSSTAGTETDSYCVMGNQLDLLPSPETLVNRTTASGAVVLTKQ